MRGSTTKLLILIIAVVIISLLHYSTNIDRAELHQVYKRLYYIPIVLGAFWFGIRGGLFFSILSSVLYSPHVLFHWRGMALAQQDRIMEIVLFNVIGLLVGALARNEKAQRLKSERTLEELNKTNEALRAQAETLVKYEEELRRADRLAALGELSAGIAHEIRNPLGGIKGAAEIVADEKTAVEKKKEFSAVLSREVERLNKVLTNFIDFARSQPPSLAPVDLERLLRSTIALVGEDLERQGIRVEWNPAEEIGSVMADEGQLSQVFLNMVLNAQAAMPDGGHLIVGVGRASKDGGTFALASFTDTGPGITKDVAPKIFDPFFTTRKGGAGLGLSVSHRIIENHGGSIDVESKPGEGSTFSIYLPL